MESFKKNLSNQLKEYRKHNNLSQEEAAELLGISTVFYGEMERAQKLPSTRMLLHLCKTIGCDEISFIISDVNTTLPDDANTLIQLIQQHPEISDILLPIAQSLLNDSNNSK